MDSVGLPSTSVVGSVEVGFINYIFLKVLFFTVLTLWVNVPFSRIPWTQTLRSPLLRTYIDQWVFPLQPGVGQNKAIHASPAAWNVYCSLFGVIFTQQPLNLTYDRNSETDFYF